MCNIYSFVFYSNPNQSFPIGFNHHQMVKQLKINIVLEKQGFEKQNSRIPILITQTVQLTENNEIMLNELILKLKRKNFNDIFDASVSYYHYAKQLFVFGFFIPKDINDRQLQAVYSSYTKRIPFQALESSPNNTGQLTCKLRLRKRIKTKVEMLIQEQQDKFGESNADHDDGKKGTKQKEKSIGEVIEKVALWRKLYTGFPSETGKTVHYELDDAATQIGVIKKTLDDYLLQIRNGKRHGYNFNKNRNGKIGQLRSFVREKKEKENKQKQSRK